MNFIKVSCLIAQAQCLTNWETGDWRLEIEEFVVAHPAINLINTCSE